MKMNTECGFCGAEEDNFLCKACVDRAREILTGVKWLEDNLTVALCRQDELSKDPHPSTRSTERPLMFSSRASDALTGLENTLVAYYLLLPSLHAHKRYESLLEGPQSLSYLALFIIAQLDQVAVHCEWAPHLLQHLEDVLEDSLTAIDGPETFVFAGWCPECSTVLYAKKDVPAVICNQDGCESTTLVLVNDGQEELLEQARGMYFNVSETAKVLQLAGFEINRDHLRRWIDKGIKIAGERHYLPHYEDETVLLGDAWWLADQYRNKKLPR